MSNFHNYTLILGTSGNDSIDNYYGNSVMINGGDGDDYIYRYYDMINSDTGNDTVSLHSNTVIGKDLG
ncbi:MAG: hypothetical protein J5497_00850 [Selenomonadaceae bacterium]|nr:hypothetical protein [Selenomonadaceae bacterium]